jgi:methylmalonyl-CoA/ethylmalonyl-CoA epimerase
LIAGADLDHVAVAVEQRADAWPRFIVDLGGTWWSHGPGIGFAFCQLAYANAMRVEILKPDNVEHNDFLRRFLDRNGPGVHHLTFKVPDIERALTEAEAAGCPPVSVNLDDPEWKEAFLHPRSALGVVVQLAQEAPAPAGDWRTAPPGGLPAPQHPQAALVHVAHAVAALDDGLRLFEGLLGGRREDEGRDANRNRWVDLAWPGPGRIRLLEPRDGAGAAWLGGRVGRIHHLAFSCHDPAAIRDARARDDSTFEIAPDRTPGVRFELYPRADPAG